MNKNQIVGRAIALGGAIFALFLNFEPVAIMLLAWIVLGEELSSERIGGIALIVIALFLSHWKVPRINACVNP